MFIVDNLSSLNNENSVDSIFNFFEISNDNNPNLGENSNSGVDVFENLHLYTKILIILSGTKLPNGPKGLRYFFFISQLFSLLGSIYFGINILVSYAFLYNSTMTISGDNSLKNILINGILFGFIFSLQSIVLLPSFYYINKRFKINISSKELVHYHIYSSASIISNIYLFITLIISVIVPAKGLVPAGYSINIYYLIMEFTITLIMSLSLYFLLIDINVSIQDLDDLNLLYTTVTSLKESDGIEVLESYVKTKKNINFQIYKTFWQISCILIICVFNILYIVYNTYQTPYPNVYDEICENCFFFKEIPFIMIIMYYSSILNEKSDEITNILLHSKFPIGSEQLLTYNIARDDGIDMKILGYSLRRKQVFINWISFCITMIIGVVKNKIF